LLLHVGQILEISYNTPGFYNQQTVFEVTGSLVVCIKMTKILKGKRSLVVYILMQIFESIWRLKNLFW